jgi:hypothetical protein
MFEVFTAVTFKMETVRSPETSVTICHATRHHILEDSNRRTKKYLSVNFLEV